MGSERQKQEGCFRCSKEGKNAFKQRNQRGVACNRYINNEVLYRHHGIYAFAVKSFVELSKYLMKLPAFQGKYLLSEHFSQDPIENYFGQLRSHGGWCKNPTIQSCISAAQSIRVQGSLAMVPYRGNSSRKRRLCSQSEGDKIDDTPLQKRKRK